MTSADRPTSELAKLTWADTIGWHMCQLDLRPRVMRGRVVLVEGAAAQTCECQVKP